MRDRAVEVEGESQMRSVHSRLILACRLVIIARHLTQMGHTDQRQSKQMSRLAIAMGQISKRDEIVAIRTQSLLSDRVNSSSAALSSGTATQ